VQLEVLTAPPLTISTRLWQNGLEIVSSKDWLGMALVKSRNPTNGIWWIVQIQPKERSEAKMTESHQLPLMGLKKQSDECFCRLDLNHPPTAVGGI